jgi:hypothetical protein
MSAGDFYFAINATFRFIHDTYGKDALVDYWTSMAREYHADTAEGFRNGGLQEVRRYWADYFAHEPGGDVGVSLTERGVELAVRDCPAIRWLKDGGREIVPYYCEHCHYISTAIAAQAGMSFTLVGGGGACHQLFSPNGGAA